MIIDSKLWSLVLLLASYLLKNASAFASYLTLNVGNACPFESWLKWLKNSESLGSVATDLLPLSLSITFHRLVLSTVKAASISARHLFLCSLRFFCTHARYFWHASNWRGLSFVLETRWPASMARALSTRHSRSYWLNCERLAFEVFLSCLFDGPLGIAYANILATTQWPLERAVHLTSLVWVCVLWLPESLMDLSALWQH